jgi:hypothetical protein
MFQKKNIIILAAGGGHDMFSAIAYIKAYLSEYRFEKIGLVGVLGFTPFHTNNPLLPDFLNTELPLIQPSVGFHRYLQFHPPREISCTEHILGNTIQELVASELEDRWMCMSSKYSPIEQSSNLFKLFTKWGMLPEDTLINIVDFGGDILTNGNQSSIISPGLDAYTLAVSQLLQEQYHYLGKLSVCFPGIDGELPSHYISNVCNTQNIKKDPINVSLWTSTLSKVYEKLEFIRPGNTIFNMLTVMKNLKVENWNRPSIYVTKQWSVGTDKTSIKLTADINWDLQPYIYTFELPTNNPFVSVFKEKDYDLFKVFSHIMTIYKKQNVHASTVKSSDFHLQFLRNDLYGKWSNKQIIYPSNSKEKCIQEVLYLDVFPHIISKDEQDRLTKTIKKLKTEGVYNVCYTLNN